MPRKYVIGIAVLLAAAGAFLPIGFALQMSWSRAVALEQQSLDNQAQRILSTRKACWTRRWKCCTG